MKFIREWGVLILILLLIIFSRIFVWSSTLVEGNSMDPILENGQRLITIGIGDINRFDLVVADETVEQAQRNNPAATSSVTVVKRVIGMPGDTITYNNDTLTINGEEYEESYLADYQELFDNGELADHYSELPLNGNLLVGQREAFVRLAQNTEAFTTDSTGNPNFTITVPEGQYFLIGDNRVVSADSRKVGSFPRSQIRGKILFRMWPLNKFGGV